MIKKCVFKSYSSEIQKKTDSEKTIAAKQSKKDVIIEQLDGKAFSIIYYCLVLVMFIYDSFEMFYKTRFIDNSIVLRTKLFLKIRFIYFDFMPRKQSQKNI